MEAYAWVFWLIVATVALIAEVSTTALISIWFVPSAGVAALISLFTDNFPIQLVVFIILSGVFLYIFRNVYKKYIKKSKEAGEDLIIGKVGKTVEDTSKTSGKVLLGDVYWKARSLTEIPKGTEIKVLEVNGTTVKVEPLG